MNKNNTECFMFENFEVPQDLIPSDPRFGVGPSLIPQKHVENLASNSVHLLGTSHRKPAVRSLCKELQDGLREYYKIPDGYEVVMGNGGATFLFDMIGLGLVREKSFHYVCGEFSKKWYDAHSNIPWIKVDKKEVDFGQGIDPENVEGYDMICCTQCETSTGVMFQNLPFVSKETLLVVDATSSAGQIPIDISMVDLYFFSPQKVFAGEGGFFIAILSPKALARAQELEKSENYRPKVMSWKSAIENSLQNQTYNTPSISGIFLINEQMKLLNHLGAKKVYAIAKEKYELIRSWVEEKPYLSFYVEDEYFRSHSVATVNIDESYCVEKIAERLRTLKVAYDIEGYRKLGKNQLRISLFHNVKMVDLLRLTKIISIMIEGSGK